MSETSWGLYVGAITNLAVAAVLNNGPWEHVDARRWLVVLGVWNEILGVLLIASPEIVDRVARIARRDGWGIRDLIARDQRGPSRASEA